MNGTPAQSKPLDPRNGLRLLMLLDLTIRSWIWSLSMASVILLLYTRDALPLKVDFHARPWGSMFELANIFAFSLLAFNVAYVLILIALRALIPSPQEGRYPVVAGMRLNRNILACGFISILTKARYNAPFPGAFVSIITNLPPFVWLMGPIFGPKSKSCYVVDPIMLDPYLIEVGRNVVIGYGTIIAAHAQERHAITLKRTFVGDDVLIGGNCIIFGGCRIGRGAVVLSGAVLESDTIVGENEIWGGLPARKLKVIPPYEENMAGERFSVPGAGA
jgi:acetyltransferase-like isoleucine patch superfamily enzyme